MPSTASQWRRRTCRRSPRTLQRFARDDRGAAAIEFIAVALMLMMGILNTVEIARYLNFSMEIENATQTATQAAWKACDTQHLPATTNCPGFAAAVTAALQTTSLGNQVSEQSGSPSEGYYCVNSSGALVLVSSVSSKPADCSSVGNASGQPGDYVLVSTTYAYTPMFPGVTVGGTFPSPITASSMMRLQ